MQAPDFWNDMEKAQNYVKELNTLKNILADFKELEMQFEDVEVLLEMGYESEDMEIVSEVKEALNIFIEHFESLRLSTLLSGEYPWPGDS